MHDMAAAPLALPCSTGIAVSSAASGDSAPFAAPAASHLAAGTASRPGNKAWHRPSFNGDLMALRHSYPSALLLLFRLLSLACSPVLFCCTSSLLRPFSRLPFLSRRCARPMR